MTFFNHFTSINTNIGNFCSGFGGLFSPCFGNFSFMNNFGFSNFNFGMPIFSNFSWFNSFTNYPSFNNISANSLWNTNLTNIRPPTFSNVDWSTSNFNNWNYNVIAPKWDTCNYDTFNRSTKRASDTKNINTGGRWEYCSLSRQAAINKAANDPKLEKLNGGSRWKISSNSFKNDIPYAKKGTTRFLNQLCAEIGEEITITSALGTSGSPHAKGNGYQSHYNNNNPKLDIGGGLSPSSANALADKLRKTGYFERVAVEVDGATAHLDVQIKESVLNKYA